jgi:hypothetical protein
MDRLRQLPGVVAVAAISHPPLGNAVNRYDFCSDVHAEHCLQQTTLNPNSYHVTPGYFATLGQSLVEGRDFTSSDNGSRHVAIVNRLFAEREWPGQSAIGHRIKTSELNAWSTVVPVLAASLALLILPSLVAIALPARRAAHLDPSRPCAASEASSSFQIFSLSCRKPSPASDSPMNTPSTGAKIKRERTP